jgi:metal-responsive CopG/Arc/MetJ family transcriptional regulator
MSKALYDSKPLKLVNICVPDSMLAAIEKIASEGHQSRSAIIRKAIEQYMKQV